MKICHVTSVHKTNDVRIFEKECTTLAQNKDYEVYLVGAGHSKRINHVNIVGVEASFSNRLERMLKFSKVVIEKALEIDADVYHLHDPELLRYALKFKVSGKKVIFDSHEDVLSSIDEKTYMPIIVRKIAKMYYRVLQRRVLKRIDGIVIVTPQQESDYQKYNENIVLLPNFPIINTNCGKDDDAIVKGRIVFAGGINRAWSHKEIIKAIEDIDDVEYYLFGIADEKYLKELESLKGWDKVHFGGIIPFDDVKRELRKANVVVALLKPGVNTYQRQGTLGNTKLFEAMEQERPLVASDLDLWKEIVNKYNCGMCVNPDDVNGIRKALIEMMGKTDMELRNIGENGLAAVKEEYSWDKSSDNLKTLYKNLQQS